jgi:Tol biopolymer transport system component
MNLKRGTLVIAALAAVLLASCGGGGGGGGGVGPGPSGTFTFTGTVVDESAAAVADASVLLSTSLATTGADGKFAFQHLAAGTYTLTVFKRGFVMLSMLLPLDAGQAAQTFTLHATSTDLAVTDINPPLAATGVPVNAALTLTFNQAIDPASVSADSFTLTPATAIGSVTVAGQQVILIFAHEFAPSTQVTVSVRAGISSASSSMPAFKTAFVCKSVDDAAPLVISATPPDGATNVPINATISLLFNDDLDPASVTAASITFFPVANPNVTASGTALNVTPQTDLAPSMPYILSVSGVTDTAGNPMTPFTLHFTTGTQRVVVQNLHPAWDHYGNRIYFSSNRPTAGGHYQIFSVNPDGTGLVQVTHAPYDNMEPTVSFDGSEIAYSSTRGGNQDIFAIDSAGTNEIRLTTTPDFDRQPSFSGTFSMLIAFATHRAGQWDIYTMNRDGSGQQDADIGLSFDVLQPAFHPFVDSQILFAANTSGNLDIFKMSGIPDAPTITNLTPALSSNETSPAFSPDASRICFISDAGGVKNVWLANYDGSFPRQLTFSLQDLDNPIFSPVSGQDRILAEVHKSDGSVDLAFFDANNGTLIDYLTHGGT